MITRACTRGTFQSFKGIQSSAMPSFVLSPHLQGVRTRNGPPPSRCTTRHRLLVFLFCFFCRPGFCADLHLGVIQMGTHVTFPEFRLLSDLMHRVQTFNSAMQSPCTVIVNLMATCDGGSEFVWLFAYPGHVVLSLSEYTLLPLSPGYVYYGPWGDADADLCYCNTVGYSIFSACGACQGQEWITCGHYIFLTFGGLSSYLSLAGRNG